MGATIARVVRQPAASASTVSRRVVGASRAPRRQAAGRATPMPATPRSVPVSIPISAQFSFRMPPVDVTGTPVPEPIRRVGVRRARDVPLEGAAARPTGPGPPCR